MKSGWCWLKRNILKILRAVWKEISNATQISFAHFKAVWWLRFLIYFVISIVAVAVWLQISRSVEEPNLFAEWIYTFLHDWAVALSATVTLLLVIAASFAILDNRNARKLEKKESLLNEIFEWAEDAAESAISRRTRIPDELWKTKLKYKYSRAKSKYIIEVTSLSFKNLSSLVKGVIVKLDQVIHATTQVINHQDPAIELVDCENELTESIEALIIEIAKIKTKDSID